MQKILVFIVMTLVIPGCAASGGREGPEGGLPDAQPVDPVCGDSTIAGSESCDDGSQLAGDGCSPQCSVEPGWSCAGEPSVCLPLCGNHLIDAGEECDGDLLDGNDCTTVAGAFTAGILACGAGCQFDTSGCQTADCGNGNVDPPEECDDGNSSNEDSCLNNCDLNVCGDGYLNPGAEDCDDNNVQSGDGCSDVCGIEEPPVLYSIGTISSGWSDQTIYFANDPHAPSTPIVAAFSVSRRSEAWVVTNTSYHALSLPGLQWVDSGPLSGNFTGLPGWQIAGSWGIDQAPAASTWVGFQAAGLAYVYTLFDTGQITADPGNPITVDWQPQPHAPAPIDVQAAWYDAHNTRGWSSCNPSTLCSTSAVALEAYGAIFTQAQTIHMFEYSHCGEFYDSMGLASFLPFAIPSAPAANDIQAAFYDNPSETLYVIAVP